MSPAASSMVFQIIGGFLHDFQGQNRHRKISGKNYSGDVEGFNDLLIVLVGAIMLSFYSCVGYRGHLVCTLTHFTNKRASLPV